MDHQPYRAVKQSAFSGLIGVTRKDITPPVGIYSRNWGAANHDVADGIHQPITLTCMTFQSKKEDKPLVLIAADLGGWKNLDDERAFRISILKSLEIEPQNLMFCLSHTHAGPSIASDDAGKTGGQFIEQYLQTLQHAAVAAVRCALNTATKATLAWLYGACSLAANRDLPEAGSKRVVVGLNPEKNSDDTLLVGRVTDSDNQIIGTIVNYACHPTTLGWDNRLISPDYVGAMRQIVETATDAPCLFLQGASGELAPAEQYSGNVKVAEKHGRQLGYAVLSVLEKMLEPSKELSFDRVVESGAALGVWKQTPVLHSDKISARLIDVPLPLKPLPSLHEIEQQYLECEDRVMKERLFRKRGVRKSVGDGEISPTPVWIWQLGDSLLVGQPNEAYSDFQVGVRRELAPVTVAVMNLVNGGVGYLPPADCYEKDIYPAWQTPYAAGSLEKLIDTAIRSAKEFIDNGK